MVTQIYRFGNFYVKFAWGVFEGGMGEETLVLAHVRTHGQHNSRNEDVAIHKTGTVERCHSSGLNLPDGFSNIVANKSFAYLTFHIFEGLKRFYVLTLRLFCRFTKSCISYSFRLFPRLTTIPCDYCRSKAINYVAKYTQVFIINASQRCKMLNGGGRRHNDSRAMFAQTLEPYPYKNWQLKCCWQSDFQECYHFTICWQIVLRGMLSSSECFFELPAATECWLSVMRPDMQIGICPMGSIPLDSTFVAEIS